MIKAVGLPPWFSWSSKKKLYGLIIREQCKALTSVSKLDRSIFMISHNKPLYGVLPWASILQDRRGQITLWQQMTRLPSLLLEGFVDCQYPCHPLILFLICLQKPKEGTWGTMIWTISALCIKSFLLMEISPKIIIQYKCLLKIAKDWRILITSSTNY